MVQMAGRHILLELSKKNELNASAVNEEAIKSARDTVHWICIYLGHVCAVERGGRCPTTAATAG
jgi:hypothetical protein